MTEKTGLSQADDQNKSTTEVPATEGDTKTEGLTPEAMEKEMREARQEAARYRRERNEQAAKVKELAEQAEKGSALQTQLQELSLKLEESENRSVFYEQAHREECKNPKIAYLLAKDANLINGGKPDWKKIKELAPELFGATITIEGKAGEGRNSSPDTRNMNDFIRKASGR